MKLDLPIKKIDFEFVSTGDCSIRLYLNEELITGNSIDTSKLQRPVNNFKIKFIKSDPADGTVFAELKKFNINDNCFLDDIKQILYTLDDRYHAVAPLANNLYFGYIGAMEFTITHKNSPLDQAAWILANNEFEYIKKQFHGDNIRQKTWENIVRDSKFMFTGSGGAPNNESIIESINLMRLQDLKEPLPVETKSNIEEWINTSNRLIIGNFDSLPHFTYSNGITDSLTSFVRDCDTLYIPEKIYCFYKPLYGDKITFRDALKDEFVAGSKVLFELPSPWYDTNLILSKIQEAKQKGCTVALDLTWLPISNDTIAIDLLLVDEIFFSMNKTWPISDLRPAFRWSKNKCNDAQTFQWEHCTYPKVAANVLVNLTKQYTFDYVYETYRDHASQLYKLFDLAPSSVLWFATHDSIKHNAQQPIWPDYYLDDFVCIRKLLEFKGKYFW